MGADHHSIFRDTAMPPKGSKKGQPPPPPPVDADDAGDVSVNAGPGGLDSYILPKSVVTKIAKESLPDGVKLQKEVPLAINKGSSIFINYLAAIAHDHVALRKQRIVQPDHILAAIDELDWGEADTAALKKDLKKQLKAFRANAEAKKAGKPLPYPSTGSARLKVTKTSSLPASADAEATAEGSASTSRGAAATAGTPVIKGPDAGDIPSDPEDEQIETFNPEWAEEYEGSPFNSDDDAPIPEDEDEEENDAVNRLGAAAAGVQAGDGLDDRQGQGASGKGIDAMDED